MHGDKTMERDQDSFGNIVSLGEQQAGHGRRLGNQLRAYWEALRRGRLVPNRSDIDPRGIEGCLEYAFILERVAPGMGRFRLAGMHLNDLLGMEVRGMPLTALFAPAGRKAIAEVTEAVFSGPAVAELDLVAETAIGKPPMKARLIILPLKSDLGDVNRALGCLVAEGEAIGRTPRRFEVAAAQVTPIVQGAPTPAELPQPVGSRLELDAEMAALLRPRALGDDPAQPRPVATPVPDQVARFTPEERRAMFRVVSPAE